VFKMDFVVRIYIGSHRDIVVLLSGGAWIAHFLDVRMALKLKKQRCKPSTFFFSPYAPRKEVRKDARRLVAERTFGIKTFS